MTHDGARPHAGLAGAALVLTAVGRRWSLGRQWLTIAVVLAAEVGLIAAWSA